MSQFLLLFALAVQPPSPPLDLKPKTSLSGLLGSFTSVAFAPDGKTIAAANTDWKVRLWETNTGKAVAILEGHTDFVNSVSFSRDGKWLASGSADKLVKLWEAGTWKEKMTLRGHADSIRSVGFSPDSKVLASGSQDGTARLWEVKTGKEITVLRRKEPSDGSSSNALWRTEPSHVVAVAFSPNGKLLAAGDSAGVSLWDLPARKELERVAVGLKSACGLSFSPDGEWRALAGMAARNGAPLVSKMFEKGQTRIVLWNVQRRKDYAGFGGDSGRVYGLAFSPDRQLLASAESDGTVKLWSSRGWRIGTLRGHRSAVYGVSFSPDGRLLATASGDNTVKLWDVPELEKQP